MFWPLLIGCVLAAWAILRIIGNERQNRIDAIENRLRIEAEKAKEEAETLFRLLIGDTEGTKDLRLNILAVDADGA